MCRLVVLHLRDHLRRRLASPTAACYQRLAQHYIGSFGKMHQHRHEWAYDDTVAK
jgi:hypothetical protein